jgi:NAD dependent epimerase/dehydratase
VDVNWTGKKVLVTGAGGFIGSHLAEKLVRLGASVRAMVHYNALGSHGWLDHSDLAGEMELLAGDICDRDSARAAVEGREVIFHLAALIAIPYSYRNPASYVRTNVEGTLNMLQAVRDASVVERFVHTSTSEVYGTAQTVPISERHPLRGQSPYSASKIGADKIVEAFHDSFDVPAVTVRPFNTFGPRQSARAIIPTIIGQCLTGDVVRVGNTAPRRDLNFVSNTVDGFIAAAAAPGAAGKTIQLGTGRDISVGELVNLIALIVGRRFRIVTDPERMRPEKSEVMRLIADYSLAKDTLGWEPRVALEEGLRLTVDWVRANLDMVRIHAYAV